MSESGHSSLPSYPTLPPSDMEQFPDLSSLSSSSVPPSFASARLRAASQPTAISSGPSGSDNWFNSSPSSGTASSPYATPNYSPTTAARYTTHQQLPATGAVGPSPAAQQHSALHMYNQGARMVAPQSSGAPLQQTATPFASNPASTSPQLRIHYLEQLCMTLRREKEQLEGEFGRQRKMFMNHMTESDNHISLAKQKNEKLSEEVRELSTQLLHRDEELKSITAASKIAQAQNREAFDVDRVKYEEEIASLRQIMDVQSRERKSAFDEEREKWRTEKCSLLAEIKLLKGRSLSPIPTPTLMTSNENSRTASPDSCLETSMLRAAEDSKILRAVIIPLEEEIDLLKTKLGEAEERIKYYENQASSSVSPERDLLTAPLISLDSPALPSNTSYSLPTSPSPTPTDPNKQLQNLLELERAATHDLEMHTKQLKSQKAFLQNEVTELTKNLEQVNKELEAERNRHNDLKKTWELANTHFIAAQDQLKGDIEHLQKKLQEGGGGGERKIEARLLGIGGGFTTESSRFHKKSLSSEALDVSGVDTVGAQAKSASWCNLHQSSAANVGRVWDLSSRVASLESELATARAEVVRLEGVRLGLETQCSRYESQLHRVQAQMVEEMDEKERSIDKLRAEMEKYKAGIMRERQFRQELRKQLDGTKDDMATRIEKFKSEEMEIASQLRILSDKFTEIKVDTQKEIARLVQERVGLYHQIEMAREEYECLKVVQATGITDYQAKLDHASKNQKEAELNLQTTMEQLSTLQDQKQVMEESLAGQLAATKEELLTTKANCERLKRELASTNDKLSSLEVVQVALKEEQRAKEEVLANKQSIERKSKEFIESQQKKLEDLNQAKESSDRQVKELQHQLGLLKSQLSHSEETQKDFVELSQSLQMRLAEIEEQQLNQSQNSLSSPT